MTKNRALSKHVVTGSLLDTMQQKGITKAEAILDIEVVVICDGSHSMNGERYRRLCTVLEEIQAEHPGKVIVISYSSYGECEVNENGHPILYGGSTDMEYALRFAKEWDNLDDITFFFLSDGEPTCSESATLAVASTFQNPINTVFIGDDTNIGAINFMKRLGKKGGGTHTDDFSQQLLRAQVNTLLLGDGRPLS